MSGWSAFVTQNAKMFALPSHCMFGCKFAYAMLHVSVKYVLHMFKQSIYMFEIISMYILQYRSKTEFATVKPT